MEINKEEISGVCENLGKEEEIELSQNSLG